MKLISLILLLILLPGCGSLPSISDLLGGSQIHKLNPEVYYRNDICFKYEVDEATAKLIKERGSFNDIRWGSSFGSYTYKAGSWNNKNGTLAFCGVGVLPYKTSYKLKVQSPGKLNFFSMITCHEEDTTENADRGIFKKNGEINIRYKPTLEKGLACPLYLSAFSKNQRHAWGMLAFEHPRYKLKATLQCNGYRTVANGVSICQSRNGLIQDLIFDEEVKQADPVKGAGDRKRECPVLPTKDNKTFRFKLPNRECIYGFIGLESGKLHQFFAVGYEDIIVRE